MARVYRLEAPLFHRKHKTFFPEVFIYAPVICAAFIICAAFKIRGTFTAFVEHNKQEKVYSKITKIKEGALLWIAEVEQRIKVPRKASLNRKLMHFE